VPAITEFVWNTTGLNAALTAGFVRSVKAAEAVAEAKNPAPSKIKIVIAKLDPEGYAVIAGRGPLAHIFEGGRRGGYEINAGFKGSRRKGVKTFRAVKGGARALHFTHGDGGFAASAIGGPMAAEPYMAPAAAAWASALYKSSVTSTLAAAGFKKL
jgi:hypothetical protein